MNISLNFHKIAFLFLVVTLLAILPINTASAENPGDAEFLQGVVLFDHGQTAEQKQSAFQFLSKAAEKGHIMGTYYLGRAYRESVGVQEDPQKSFFHVLRAADSGSAIAQGKVCDFYKTGYGTEKNIEKAIAYCTKSAESKWPTGYRRLGEIYQFEKKDVPKALYWYEKAATFLEKGPCDALYANGDPYAQFAMGWLLWHEESVKDFEKGFRFMKMGAAHNDVNALYELGVYYLGSPQKIIDPEQSFASFYQAATEGHADAPTFLAGMYWDGIGTERNPFQAYKWTLVALRTVSPDNKSVVTNNEARMRTKLSAPEVQDAQDFALKWKPRARVAYKSQWFVVEDFFESAAYDCAPLKPI